MVSLIFFFLGAMVGAKVSYKKFIQILKETAKELSEKGKLP